MTTPVGATVELDDDVETALNAGWITREDLALKRRLSGIKVPVANEQRVPDNDGDGEGTLVTFDGKRRAVPVYFRLPENETRAKTYPYITIDFLTVERATDREHRGVHDYGVPNADGSLNAYTPPGLPVDEDGIAIPSRTELPVPYDITYQVTQFSRYNRHDREIMTTLLTTRLEPRFGYLEMVPVDGVPDDGSVRRMDLVSGPTNGDTRDTQGKRVFRKMYTVSVQTELFHEEFQRLAQVARVVLDVDELA